MKKCPPGVICIENITLTFIFICLLILSFIFYQMMKYSGKKEKIIIKETRNQYNNYDYAENIPSYPYNNLSNDVLLNPYIPPLQDERYLVNLPTRGVPINISTNQGAVDTSYRQVGILTPTIKTKKENILALMGRPLFVNRDKWQYYTMSDQNNSVKLPISKNGRSCTNEYGCDKLYNGDTVYIEGYNNVFRVTIYDNDVIKYIPFV